MSATADITVARQPKRWLFARFLNVTVARMLLALFRVRALHRDRVPSTGAILAGNHVSYGDPVLLWCIAPRRVRFMAKSELWRSALLGWACEHVGAFPVRRGESDRQAISAATNFLKSGELVGIFPEGTRVREGESAAHGGVAFIAMRAGVPVVPVGIVGTDRIKPKGSFLLRFPRVTFVFGEPVSPSDFDSLPGRKERIEAMTAEVMRRIDAALAEAEEAR